MKSQSTRMSQKTTPLLGVCVLAPALFFIAVLVTGAALGFSRSALLIGTAQAQSAEPSPVERARKDLESLIARLRGRDMPEGIVKTNGRLEATEVDVAAKYPGRLATVTVNEGDEVTAGQVVATISSPETEAQLRAAQAQLLKAKQALAEAIALIAQRNSDLTTARNDFERGKALVGQGWLTQQVFDQRRNRFEAAEATYAAAEAQRDQAESQIKSAQATVEQLQSVLVDLVLVSPRSGRVQYRLARAGEVVAAGQRVLTILDLQDVYMTIYLPADVAGKLMLGDEARIIARSISRNTSFPPPSASWRPTPSLRPRALRRRRSGEKLMFRVKLQGDPKVLEKYHRAVKTGVRGLGFVRTDPKVPWPARASSEASAMTKAAVASVERVTHRYGKTFALNDLTLDIPAQCMVGLIGPDGVGKSTLLALISGVRKIQAGKVMVLDGNMADERHRRASYGRIAYMPQGLGRNLYPTLSVFDNIDFFGRLFGQGEAERRARIDELLKATGLDPFADRPCGKLSGGMKQKVSLCCSLMHDPDLLVLDEPTTGVDPLSRRQFWELIDSIRVRRPLMSVIVATAYMDEASRFDWLAAMDDGKVIAHGAPKEILARSAKRARLTTPS